MLLVLIITLVSLAVIVYVDRLISQRRSQLVNSRYTERLDEGRKDSQLHLLGFENRMGWKASRNNLNFGPAIEVRRPGFFSKQRTVTDGFGRIVATHYEELVANDLEPRLMLNAGTVHEPSFTVAA
jgi:hypothetical protein